MLILTAFLAPTASAQSLTDLLSAVLGAVSGSSGEQAAEVVGTVLGANDHGTLQQGLSQWGIPAGNYSGITPIEALASSSDGSVSCRYAVVSDKGSSDGFFVWKIVQDATDGHVIEVVNEGFRANKVTPSASRDCEGVVFVPGANGAAGRGGESRAGGASSRGGAYSSGGESVGTAGLTDGTVFISGEGDGRIIEYDMEGQRTGRELQVPEVFKSAISNQGLEALAYGGSKKPLFWATTETMLPGDAGAAGVAGGKAGGAVSSDAGAAGTMNLLRIASFGANLKAGDQWAYRMEPAEVRTAGPTYAFGVPELCALPDGRLLVLEREANVTSAYVGSTVSCHLFSVKPKRSKRLRSDRPLSDFPDRSFLRKKLIDSWSTSLSLAGINWANYEGMCLGAPLTDGRLTLLLISDSQGGYGKAGFSLSDWIKVVVLE